MNKFFVYSFLLFCWPFFLVSQSPLIKIDTNCLYSIYKYPHPKIPIKDFYINEGGTPFISLNGGVYLPKDSVWFLSAKKERYTISFNANPTDTAIFLLTRDSVFTNLVYLKSKQDAKFRAINLLSFEPGIFNLIYKNKKLYVWGFSKGKYKIGIVTPEKIEWVADMKEKITSVAIDNNDRILFSIDKLIFDVYSREVIFVSDTLINGFYIIENNGFLISNALGVFQKENNKIKYIPTKIKGAIKRFKNKIYVLSDEYPILLEISEQ